jgi:hypothetical protein
MRFKSVGSKRDSTYVVVHNADTVTIPQGSPLTLVFNATNDGLDVVLPSTAGDAKNGAYKYGIATASMIVGQYAEAQVFGYCPYALATAMTRGASTNSWTSSASVASGAAMGWDSVNNALAFNASMVGSLGTLGAFVVNVDSVASYAASATATTDTRTVIVIPIRAFVRMMG